MNLAQATIFSVLEGIKKKNFSVRELVEYYLKRIENLEPKINAFITVCTKKSLASAEEVDKKIAKTENLEKLFQQQPLLGIPIAIKDIFSTKGIKTTAGSNVLANYIPVYDATAVARLQNAGAIVLGKTNLDAWAHGSSGENSDFGPTRNPWNLERVPGGSSSGSAAALCSNMALVTTGTDTAGSIRLPASFCNLVGLKPTYGRVSRYGIISMASSLDTVGHFTKTVSESAYLLPIIAGQDTYDATASRLPVPNYLDNLKKGIKGIRIGIPKEYFLKGIDKEVEIIIRQAIKNLSHQGAEIINVTLPHTQCAIATYYIIMPSEVSSNLARYDGIRFGFGRDKFSPEAKRRIMLGTYTLSSGYYDAYYLKAMKVRSLICQDFEKVFKKVDVLLTPVSPTPAFKLGEKTKDPLTMYLSDIFTATANLAGIPGLVVPVGFVNHLPVGMQILGPQFSESNLFRVGYAYEHTHPWYKMNPKT